MSLRWANLVGSFDVKVLITRVLAPGQLSWANTIVYLLHAWLSSTP